MEILSHLAKEFVLFRGKHVTAFGQEPEDALALMGNLVNNPGAFSPDAITDDWAQRLPPGPDDQPSYLALPQAA